MKVVVLGNGRVAVELTRWLAETGNAPSALVVHPAERARNLAQLLQVAALPQSRVIEGHRLNQPAGIAWMKELAPDWLLSFSFGYYVSSAIRSLPLLGSLNLHPALLPFNRGAHPNVWSIVERTPAGVTLHVMDNGIDTGEIVAQAGVETLDVDTGESLYGKLEDASIELFKAHWLRIREGKFRTEPQIGSGSTHKRTELSKIDRIDPGAMYRANELIDILRARTFPPFHGAYLDFGDRRVYLSLQLTEARVNESDS